MDLGKRVLSLLEAGLSVIPVGREKRPTIKSWTRYQSERASADQVRAWFGPGIGYAIIGGPVSGGLEVLDFDDPDAYVAWTKEVEADGISLDRLPIIRTPSGGTHVLLKRANPARNQKLARDEKQEVRIETRGDGGYIVGPGSSSQCHPAGGEWVQISGPDLAKWATVPVLPDGVYQVFIAYARALNHDPALKFDAELAGAHQGGSGWDVRPGVEYNERASWEEILEPAGWTKVREVGDVTHWRRPGKSDGGTSATTGFCSNGQRDLLYVFSTNAAPFEDQKAYDRFGAFALLQHGGDFSAAARVLHTQGYGRRGKTSAKSLDAQLAALEEQVKDAGDQKLLKRIQDARRDVAPAVEAEPDMASDRSSAIQELRTWLELPLTAIIQTRVETPSYVLDLENGDAIRVPDSKVLTEQRRFELAVFEATRRLLPPKAKSKTGWQRVLTLFTMSIQVEDLTYRERNDTIERLLDYLRASRVFSADTEEGWEPALTDSEPFIQENLVWIHANSYRSWLRYRLGIVITHNDTLDQLRSAGLRRAQVSGRPGKGQSNVSRSYWVLPAEVGESYIGEIAALRKAFQ